MPDNTTAAIWFAEHFLSDRFQKLAKSKQSDIAAFNNQIVDMSRNHHNAVRTAKYCYQCGKQFTGQSKPTECPSCNHFVHKACNKPHLSTCVNKIHQSSSFPPYLPRGQSKEQDYPVRHLHLLHQLSQSVLLKMILCLLRTPLPPQDSQI